MLLTLVKIKASRTCWCCHVEQQTNNWASFPPLIVMLVGNRVLVCCWLNWFIVFWYNSCSGLLHMELYASNLLFLSEAWKAVRACSPWEVHTKSLSCDQMNTGSLWASWCILATWTQELVSVSYGFRMVHTGPCGRIGLETPTVMINLPGCTEPASACMRPVRFRTRSIGSARLSRVFYSRWESLTFGQGLSPTVPKLCKILCGLARHT